MSADSLRGKTALVTGAGSGIGRHIATALAAQGAYVVLAGRQLSALRQTAEEIERSNGHSLAIATDVRDETSVEGLLEKTVTSTGRLDIAINAAGVLRTGAVDDFAVEDFQAVFATNTFGAWLCLKHEIRAMKRQGSGGVIVNIASNVGYHLTRPGTGAYAASKAAVAVLTKTAALEAIDSGIRINSISPGPVDTAMSYRTGEDRNVRNARIAASNPSKRVASLDEIAQTVLWLCSDGAAYMVGHDLVVDGGASL
ncbi:SDR family NAD(P)-dependent oxidoreductase [Brenneria corticis]|uniref:Short-chain dehydrogenase n=1 Tax=Brenneria corticis TaxID=2173106 RepID=A0A2U1UB00_9GAMM|nr:SDR family oxidoreductase [Brenneria sp. CFCC 11842]PWC18866.1 short-chain dehydrogenase [Brenneria sp. CFCC 11842]